MKRTAYNRQECMRKIENNKGEEMKRDRERKKKKKNTEKEKVWENSK